MTGSARGLLQGWLLLPTQSSNLSCNGKSMSSAGLPCLTSSPPPVQGAGSRLTSSRDWGIREGWSASGWAARTGGNPESSGLFLEPNLSLFLSAVGLAVVDGRVRGEKKFQSAFYSVLNQFN